VVKAARAVPLWLIAGLAVIVVLISLGPLLDRSSPAGTAQRSVTGRGQVTAEPSAPTSASDDGAGTSASTAPAPSEGVPGATSEGVPGATSEEVPGATAAPPPGASTASPTGDLGLATPISRPPCDGQWIVLVGATTTPGQYPDGVDHLLQSYPGSHYLLTEGSCASLRQGLPDGSVIYAVYFGPYPTPAAACGMRVQVGDHAYVKVLDDVAPPDRPWKC
jgi:serine/threonine-protein kinase